MPLKFRQIQHLDKGTPLVVTVHHRNGETTENKGILQYCLNDRFSIANEIKKGVHSSWNFTSWMDKDGEFKETEVGRKWIIELDSNPLPLEAYSYPVNVDRVAYPNSH